MNWAEIGTQIIVGIIGVLLTGLATAFDVDWDTDVMDWLYCICVIS